MDLKIKRKALAIAMAMRLSEVALSIWNQEDNADKIFRYPDTPMLAVKLGDQMRVILEAFLEEHKAYEL